MTSPLLALFIRSLRQDLYGKATYWTRTGLCAFTIFLLFIIVQQSGWIGAPGLYFFVSLIGLQMIAISLVGLSYFGSAITEEKEELTLGLLRMTDLSPVSILLGKSTSRLCGALLLLAAAFPFTVFAVTLGGVSLGQIIASYCTMGAYAFLLGNVALLGSVLARHTGGAAKFTSVVVGTQLGAGWLLKELNDSLRSPLLSVIAESLWQSNPVVRLIEILGTRSAVTPVGWQVASNLALGFVCFFLAWAAFGHFCDRSTDTPPGNFSKSMRIRGLLRGRPSRPANHPVAWKDYRFLYGGNRWLAFRVAGYLVIPSITLLILLLTTSSHFSEVLALMDTWMTLLIYLDTGAMAALVFRSELNDQTLSVLATLPGNLTRIAYRKVRILLLIATPGAIFVIGIEVVKRWFGSRFGSASFPVLEVLVQAVIFSITAILYLHLVAWFSLFLKRGALPVGIVATLAIVLVVNIGSSILESAMRAKGVYWSVSGNLTPGFLMISAIHLTIAAFLHLHGLRRLEALAAAG